jgi:PAS domain S-box-containing protein
MIHHILIYIKDTHAGKRVRLLVENAFPGCILSIKNNIQDLTETVLQSPLPHLIIFYFNEINVNEVAHFFKIIQLVDPSKSPAIVLYGSGVDLSIFNESKIEALFSANIPDNKLAGLLRATLLNKDEAFAKSFDGMRGSPETWKTMNALRETERQVWTMIDNLPGIAYRCKIDANWTMKFISKNAHELTGYTSDDFLENKRLSYSDIIFIDDKEYVAKIIQDSINKNQPFQMEYRIVTKTNKLKWVWEQGRQVQIQGLNEKLLEGLIMDITEKKHAQIRLEVMKNISNSTSHTRDLTELTELIEKELRKLINTKNFIIAIYDEKNNSFSLPFMKDERDFFTEIPATKTISGIVIKRNKSMLLFADDINRLEKSGEIIRVGSPAKCWLGVPLKIDDKVTGIIVLQDYEDEHSIGTDEKDLLEFVSTQVATAIIKKQADEEIHRLTQSIHQSPVSVAITNTEKRIIYVNQKFLDVTGFTREEAIGSKSDLIRPGKTPEKIYKDMARALDSGKEFRGEFLHQKKDGTLFWEQAFVSPVKNDKGEITHYIAVKEDISARKKMEEDLINAKEKAEESDRLKTAFLANMSHEIRTPMNAIIGFTEMLHDGIVLNEEREKLSKLIIDNGRKLLSIIDDIVDIAKIEAGQLKIIPGRCSANKIIYDHFYSFKELRSKLGKEHIDIIVKQHVQNENFIFNSDLQRINQVISNLMSNALKYTIEGKIELGYKIHGKKEGNFIDFYVKDTGIGIKADNIEKIFDRFRQLDLSSTREFGGTGLGLAISIHLAHLLGGKIDVQSKFGKGSTFHLVLPFTEIVDDHFEPDKPEVTITRQDWSNKKIMIAEDEDSNFHLLEIMLRKSKVKIIRAYNGKEAVDYIRGGKEVDLILMDVRMPLMDGYEATAMIKKTKPDIPIVAQTAYALAGDRTESMDAGCDAYITKPIRKQVLLDIVGKFLDK